ncbi:AMP-binding protein [Pendulispora rubella]|uniref:AMP-binding protein n=1 Tax=Pendulispora rubella TaxID=2741070 RepID=A0ABZ2L5U7_9BACT
MDSFIPNLVHASGGRALARVEPRARDVSDVVLGVPQEQAPTSSILENQLAYWRNQLAGAPTALSLLTDRPRPPFPAYRGDMIRVELPHGIADAVRRFSQHRGLTPFSTLFAAFAALMHRYTDRNDVCIGSDFVGGGVANAMSMSVNTVVLRSRAADDATFRDLALNAQDVILDAAMNQGYPFHELVEALKIAGGPSRDPFVQTMFSFHDGGVSGPRFGEGSTKFDLGVVAIPDDDRIFMTWEYNCDLFERPTIERMIGHFVRLLDAAVREPDTLVSRLPLLDDAEQRELLTKFNATAPAKAASAPVHQRIIAQARRTPDALAVRDAQGEMTYADLLARASRLARRLRRIGVGSDEIVGVCLPRSQAMVVAQLGILMTGAAYLPVDAGQPQARLAFLFTDAGSRRVITSRALRALLPPELEALYLDDVKEDGPLEASEVAPGDLACVVYASDSAGGAMLEHGALSNFIEWTRSEFGVGVTSRVACGHSPAFDSPITEIWTALTSGASLHMAEDEICISPPRLQTWMLDQGITVVGERLLPLPWPETSALRRISGMTTYVLDRARRPVPIGVAGELYIGGVGVARGYVNRPELDGERFVADPFSERPSSRLYRTGERVRYLADGSIEFLGSIASTHVG